MPPKTVHFAELIREIDQQMHPLGKEKIKAENQKLRLTSRIFRRGRNKTS